MRRRSERYAWVHHGPQRRGLGALGQEKMQPPAPAKIYGGSENDIWLNPPHVDERSLPGWQDLASGPGDAEARWLRFAKLNPIIVRDIKNAHQIMQRRDYDSGTEYLRDYRDQQANKKALRSMYDGLVLDTYYAWRAITVARYHAEHDARIKKWKIGIALIAAGAVAATFLGPSSAGAVKAAGAVAPGGAAATGSSILTPITVTAKPLALVGGKVVTAGAAAAAAAAPAASALTPITVAAKPLVLKAAGAAAASQILTPVTVAAKPLTEAAINTSIQKAIPKVVSAVNTVRTIEAIANGDVPPPPIALEGSSFTDYAMSVGTSLLDEKLKSKQVELTTAQREATLREMEAEIRTIQSRATQIQGPSSQAPYMPLQQVAPAIQAAPATDWRTIALVGVPILIAIITRT